ncbi:MAG: mechanosensitive ion channel protein MscS, partial [Flavobacteriaceae bacterium]|nr:mechanosensitive ion channel protein MscS [Flavobacteriaceae bacterium]
MESVEFLNYEFLDNSLRDYFYFIIAFVLGTILIIPVKAFISKVLIKLSGKESDSNDIKKYNLLLKKPLQYFLLLIVLYFSVNFLNLPDFMTFKEGSVVNFEEYLTKTYNLFLLVTVFWVVSRFIDFVGYKLKNKALKTESKVDDQLIPFAIDIAKVLTIVLGFVMILGNVFNVNVTALVAGLGIGGVAFALASKESLENLLGSFTIFFDKPFIVGDTVTLGGVTGTVEKVGFRSTRIRTFDKSVVTVPNKNIISTELDNLGARPVRRVKFNIGLTYDT